MPDKLRPATPEQAIAAARLVALGVPHQEAVRQILDGEKPRQERMLMEEVVR